MSRRTIFRISLWLSVIVIWIGVARSVVKFSEAPLPQTAYQYHQKEVFVSRIGDSKDIPDAIRQRMSRLRRDMVNRNNERIIKECQKYIEENPNSPYAYKFIEYLAIGFSGEKNYEKSLEQLDRLRQMDIPMEDRSWMHYMYGFIYQDMKNYDKAIEHFDIVFSEYYEFESQERILYEKADVYKLMNDKPLEKQMLYEIVQWHPEGSYFEYAQNRLGDLYLYEGEYKKSFKHYYYRGVWLSLLWMIVGSLTLAGIFLLVFFLIFRIFFKKKREDVKNSPYKLRHLFWLMVVSFGAIAGPLFVGMMAYDYYVFDIFTRLHLNPELLAVAVTQIVLVFIVIHILKDKYHFNREAIGLFSKGLKHTIGIPVLLTILLLTFSVTWTLLLETWGISDIPETEVSEVIKNVIGGHNKAQITLLGVLVFIIVPFSEELIFRVFLIQYVKKYTNLTFAAILSCVIFTFGHGPAVILPFYLFFSGVLTVTYLRTKTIIPCVMTHTFYNMILFMGSVSLG